jgi:hypothetical protein
VRATGVEVGHVELEVLLDDYIGDSDDFLASEADRREKTRAHEEAITEGGRQVRDMAMRRKTEPRDIELYQDGEGSGDEDEVDEVIVGSRVSPETAQRGRINSTPGSRGSSSFEIGVCVEGDILRLVQAGNSAQTSELNKAAEIESRRLSFDNERETRHHELEQKRVEVETRRAKTEEDREARLQRK